MIWLLLTLDTQLFLVGYLEKKASSKWCSSKLWEKWQLDSCLIYTVETYVGRKSFDWVNLQFFNLSYDCRLNENKISNQYWFFISLFSFHTFPLQASPGLMILPGLPSRQKLVDNSEWHVLFFYTTCSAWKWNILQFGNWEVFWLSYHFMSCTLMLSLTLNN